MKPPGAVEEWARRVIALELGAVVLHHDDNTADGMYDLRIGGVNHPHAAIEVVAAVDGTWTATWNIAAANSPYPVHQPGAWWLVVSPEARWKKVRAALPALLDYMDAHGLDDMPARTVAYRQRDEAFADLLRSLRIDWLRRSTRTGAGRVHVTLPARGAFVSRGTQQLGDWLERFWASVPDVLTKLDVQATERHVFLPVTLAGAPDSIVLQLWQEDRRLPNGPPPLPAPLTHLWLLSTLATTGIRWDGLAWRRFVCRGPGIEDDLAPN